MNKVVILSGPYAGQQETVIADIAPPKSETLAHLVRLQSGEVVICQPSEIKEEAA